MDVTYLFCGCNPTGWRTQPHHSAGDTYLFCECSPTGWRTQHAQMADAATPQCGCHIPVLWVQHTCFVDVTPLDGGYKPHHRAAATPQQGCRGISRWFIETPPGYLRDNVKASVRSKKCVQPTNISQSIVYLSPTFLIGLSRNRNMFMLSSITCSTISVLSPSGTSMPFSSNKTCIGLNSLSPLL